MARFLRTRSRNSWARPPGVSSPTAFEVRGRADQVVDDTWILGPGAVVACVAVNRFDAFRCLGGRRSETQIRGFNWTGEVDRVLGVVSRYPLPLADILEPE